jgi:endonuclease YncB( thermonuclease family)
MSRLTVMVAAVSLVAPAFAEAKGPPPAPSPRIEVTAHVVRVEDGDTLKVSVADVPFRVRLRGLDAPELSQRFGKEAREFVADLTHDRDVTIVLAGADRGGPRTADVFLHDGRSLNREVVKAGYAWSAGKTSDWRKAEAQARVDRKGLWADRHPIAPWRFRRTAGAHAVGGEGRGAP